MNPPVASLPGLIAQLWDDYTTINPQARAIHDLLRQHQNSNDTINLPADPIVNDHIAFRTFDDPRIGAPTLARSFTSLGYEPKGQYEFTEKKLFAKHYEHPDPAHPKIFVSQLKVGEFSEKFRGIVRGLIDQIPVDLPDRWDLPAAGRPWAIPYGDYETLRTESEYGAWLAAWGLRANHFTLDVSALPGFDSLSAFNAFLESNGFELNPAGGKIKGSPGAYLEQSSTLAAPADVRFTDGPRTIPGCYYEFAWRHRLPSGQRFEGFITGSADKIFESTDRRDD